MSNNIRALIVTDSLGCPRAETDVKDTWTEMVLQKWCGDIVFYTQCCRGLSARDVDYDHMHWLMPNIIICQIGVVDCSRRVLNRVELKVISKIPVLNKWIHIFCSKNTYTLTKIRNRHYQTETQFMKKMQSIIDNNQCEVYFIEIAPPSSYMKKKLYNFEKDVDSYNNILKSLEFRNGGGVIEAYHGIDDIDELFLEDGHHLTSYGVDLVFSSVDKVLQDYVKRNVR